jgi:hypothetical protein
MPPLPRLRRSQWGKLSDGMSSRTFHVPARRKRPRPRCQTPSCQRSLPWFKSPRDGPTSRYVESTARSGAWIATGDGNRSMTRPANWLRPLKNSPRPRTIMTKENNDGPTKTCIVCGEEKGEDEFYLLAGKYKGTGRTMNRCKTCHNAVCSERQKSSEAKAAVKRWKADNPERVRELNRKHSKLWRQQNPKKYRELKRKSRSNSVSKRSRPHLGAHTRGHKESIP